MNSHALIPWSNCFLCKQCHATSVVLQNDLRMSKEKARRKQAIIQRQEEELAAREGSLDSMRKDTASSSRQMEHLQEDNQALKVSLATAGCCQRRDVRCLTILKPLNNAY